MKLGGRDHTESDMEVHDIRVEPNDITHGGSESEKAYQVSLIRGSASPIRR